MDNMSMHDAESINYDDPRDREKIFETARASGCEVVLCADDEIQLDIDEPWPFGSNKTHIDNVIIRSGCAGLIPGFYSVVAWVAFSGSEAWKSRGGNTHVVLKLQHPEKFDIKDRITLAVCLGSDPTREHLNLKRVKDGTPNPIALFRPVNTKETRASA